MAIMKKNEAQSMADLVRYAIRAKVIEPYQRRRISTLGKSGQTARQVSLASL
jgi:hypothetical protein